MRTVSLHVPDDEYAELKSLAARRGRPVASMIRDAMSRHLADERASVSVLDAVPHRARALGAEWSRDELYDEMLERWSSPSTPTSS